MIISCADSDISARARSEVSFPAAGGGGGKSRAGEKKIYVREFAGMFGLLNRAVLAVISFLVGCCLERCD
jgi:hypothetical protein